MKYIQTLMLSLCTLLIILNILDISTTYIGLNFFNAVETNHLIMNTPNYIWIVMKLMLSSIIFIIAYYSVREFNKNNDSNYIVLLFIPMIIVNIIYIGVIINNIIVILV